MSASCGDVGLHSNNNLCFRGQEAWEAPFRQTTSHGHGSALHQAILHEDRNPPDEPVLAGSDRDVFGLQNGGISPAYPVGRERGSLVMAWYVIPR